MRGYEEDGRLEQEAMCATNVEEILALFPRLGIPHFQRGLVWNDDAVGLLLKSLYLRTPCGNIILWQPRETEAQGVPLHGDVFTYLIVDGQQRIRSLHGALTGTPDDTEPSESEWCLNLAADPGFEKWFKEATRFNLFVRAKRPKPDKPWSHISLVPLRLLLSCEAVDTDQVTTYLKLHDASCIQTQAVFDAARSKVRNMMSHRVFARMTLAEESGGYGLAEVIDIYNRINSAGRRVEAEERAYATLVSISPCAQDHLQEFFRTVHPDQDRHTGMERDNLLQRRRESAFGFKLFIRTFVQVCNYHLGRSQGSDALSFEVLDKRDVYRRLKENVADTNELLLITRDILTTIHSILANELNCDDLQMLPDTACLVPVVEMLIRFAKLRKREGAAYKGFLAYFILRLALGPDRTQDKFLKLAAEIDRSHTAGECCVHIHSKLPWDERCKRRLGECLKGGNTLSDRYLLLSYWLVRKRKATDFSYQENGVPHLYERFGGAETPVCRQVDPEKQHIVPVSMMKQVFGPEEKIRNARHPVNNIGNLTFISQALNGFGGLSEKPANLAHEPEDNLHRHFIHADLVKSYEELVTTPEERLKRFELFCEKRRVSIQRGFEEWLDELRPSFSVSERLEPERRVFTPDQGDRVRDLGFPDAVEDVLLRLLGGGVLLSSDNKGKVRFYLGGKRPKAAEVFLFPGGDRIEIEDKPGLPHMDVLRRIAAERGMVPVSACPFCPITHSPPRWLLPSISPETPAILTDLMRQMESHVVKNETGAGPLVGSGSV